MKIIKKEKKKNNSFIYKILKIYKEMPFKEKFMCFLVLINVFFYTVSFYIDNKAKIILIYAAFSTSILLGMSLTYKLVKDYVKDIEYKNHFLISSSGLM